MRGGDIMSDKASPRLVGIGGTLKWPAKPRSRVVALIFSAGGRTLVYRARLAGVGGCIENRMAFTAASVYIAGAGSGATPQLLPPVASGHRRHYWRCRTQRQVVRAGRG